MTVSRPVVLPVYWSLGLNNFKMEIRRSIVMAKLSRRALCLIPIEDGGTFAGSRWPVSIESIYDVDLLSRFVEIYPERDCPAPLACEVPYSMCGRAVNQTFAATTVSAGVLRQKLQGFDAFDCLAVHRCGVSPLTAVTTFYDLWLNLRKPRAVVTAAENAVLQLFRDPNAAFLALHWRCPHERRS